METNRMEIFGLNSPGKKFMPAGGGVFALELKEGNKIVYKNFSLEVYFTKANGESVLLEREEIPAFVIRSLRNLLSGTSLEDEF